MPFVRLVFKAKTKDWQKRGLIRGRIFLTKECITDNREVERARSMGLSVMRSQQPRHGIGSKSSGGITRGPAANRLYKSYSDSNLGHKSFSLHSKKPTRTTCFSFPAQIDKKNILDDRRCDISISKIVRLAIDQAREASSSELQPIAQLPAQDIAQRMFGVTSPTSAHHRHGSYLRWISS